MRQRDDQEPSGRVQLGEGQVLAMAAAAWCGAWLAWPIALAPTVPVLILCLMARRPWATVLAVGLLASALGHRSDEAFVAVEATTVDGVVVSVVSDPRPVGQGWRSTVRLPEGQRVDAWAYGSAGFTMSQATVGDRLVVSGKLDEIDDSGWARSRHLLGRLGVSEASSVGGPTGPRALVELIRSRIVAGAEPLPETLRPLYLGLVVGEDRFQPAEQRATFAAAGLAHLLAVSGQNVAFVLAVVRPASDRLSPRGRTVITVMVLVLFALTTRLEPSVLRATGTAALAAIAASDGHRQSGVRLLALAVTGLVLVDPFLVHSLGFQLSVAASGGILVLTPVLLARARGPRWLAEPLAVTIGAQLGVAPLLIRVFGPVSAVSIPANLLAGWAAGAVMMWGLTIGPVAGVLGARVGGWLQLPVRAALWWLNAVAAWAARFPAPLLGGWALLSVVTVVVGWWLAAGGRGRAGRTVLRLALGLILVAVCATSVPRTPSAPTTLAGGGMWLPPGHDAPSILIVSADADDRLLGELIESNITSIDVMVVAAGGRASEVARSVLHLVAVELALAPPLHRLVGGTRLTEPLRLATSGPDVVLTPQGRSLQVEIEAKQP